MKKKLLNRDYVEQMSNKCRMFFLKDTQKQINKELDVRKQADLRKCHYNLLRRNRSLEELHGIYLKLVQRMVLIADKRRNLLQIITESVQMVDNTLKVYYKDGKTTWVYVINKEDGVFAVTVTLADLSLRHKKIHKLTGGDVAYELGEQLYCITQSLNSHWRFDVWQRICKIATAKLRVTYVAPVNHEHMIVVGIAGTNYDVLIHPQSNLKHEFNFYNRNQNINIQL